MNKFIIKYYFIVATWWQDKFGISFHYKKCRVSFNRILLDNKKNNFWVTLPFVAMTRVSESKDVISSLNQDVYEGELPDSAFLMPLLIILSVTLLLMLSIFSLQRFKIENLVLLICFYLSFNL